MGIGQAAGGGGGGGGELLPLECLKSQHLSLHIPPLHYHPSFVFVCMCMHVCLCVCYYVV